MIEDIEINETHSGDETEQSLAQEEMTIGVMIVIGICCGILACILFTLCSERWDYYITKKMWGGQSADGQFLHDNDERSSDLSDLVNDWESGSDDSSSDESNIREHGYWINALIQEITVHKPPVENIPNILPPMLNDDTSSISFATSSSNSRFDHDVTNITVNHGIGKDEEDDEIMSKVANVEPWLLNRKDVPLCKTIRRLLRVASDSYDDDSEYSSGCSSLTFSDETTVACSNEWKSQLNKNEVNVFCDVEGKGKCCSEDSTVACDNKGKERDNTGVWSEITMNTTDSDDSLERGDYRKNRKGWKTKKRTESVNCILGNFETSRDRSSLRMHRSVSILIPTISRKRERSHQEEVQSRDSSNSSLTISDEDSQYGFLDGREEI